MRKILPFLFLLAALPAQAEWGQFDYDFDENVKPWQEVQAQLPAYPKDENLTPFIVSATNRNRHHIDFPPVSVGEDRISLSWARAEIEDFAAYRLYRSVDATVDDGDSLVADIDDVATTSFTDTGLVPMRGDKSGSRDCLVLASEPAHGMVVRHDPWTPGVDLLCSSFGKYVESWTAFLVDTFDAEGRRKPDRADAQFSASFTATIDTAVAELRQRSDIQTWLGGLDTAVSSGADFE